MALKTINSTETQSQLYKQFRHYINSDQFPCIMGKSLAQNSQIDFHRYSAIADEGCTVHLLSDLLNYTRAVEGSKRYYSFIAAFPDLKVKSELQFENLLWRQLQLLHDLDEAAWDETVESDPEHQNFSFSVGGNAFYVIGVHPKSSRMARRAPAPALVFNLHAQFENLRRKGIYHQVQKQIRDNDRQIQGSINPMLDDFGNSSEARQYSGRQVSNSWKCPFSSHRK